MKLILYNDDFGVTFGLTHAVKQSYLNGTTTSTSLRTNGHAFRYALDEILPAIPGLEVGLHVNLTEGPPTADPALVPGLVNGQGFFRRSFTDYYFGLRGRGNLLAQIEVEIRAQFEEAAAHGLKLNHVNGHQHVHMIPPIFEILCRAVKDHGVKFIRIPREPFFLAPCWTENRHMICRLNLLKHFLLRHLSLRSSETLDRFGLESVGCFIGVLYTGRMTVKVLERALKMMQRRRIEMAEVLFHPADVDHEGDLTVKRVRVPEYYYLKERRIEKENLLSSEMKRLIIREKIRAVTHQMLDDDSLKGQKGWNATQGPFV